MSAAGPVGRRGVAVVTGAAAGLGRSIAREFAAGGYDVGLIARDELSLRAAAAEVEGAGRRALVLVLDVADAAAVEAAAGAVELRLGPIDVWVNNAMVSVFSPVREMTAAEYRTVTEVTYLGYVHGTLAALRRMLPRDHGVIVQVGSALAYRAIPLQSAYCAAKHAIQGFNESLRTELLHDRSRVWTTMVQMPALNTPQFDWVRSRLPNRPQPVPPIFQPEVGARAVYWAAHNQRRETAVGLSAWGSIFLNKFIPGVLDRYLARTGYASQQTAEPEPADRPDDLHQPLVGDHGAHGRFDDRARAASDPTTRLEVWLTLHPNLAMAVAGATVLGCVSVLAMRRGALGTGVAA